MSAATVSAAELAKRVSNAALTLAERAVAHELVDGDSTAALDAYDAALGQFLADLSALQAMAEGRPA